MDMFWIESDLIDKVGTKKGYSLDNKWTYVIISAFCQKHIPISHRFIGSLLFLSTRTRPEICVAVNLLCRHSSHPKSCHLVAAKSVLRYVQGTRNYGLTLKLGDGLLVGFSDSDWGSDCVDRKSTSGLLLQLNGSSVVWKSKKLPLVALSTSEAEFVSASEMCKDILWIRLFLKELGLEQVEATELMEDNKGSACLGK